MRVSLGHEPLMYTMQIEIFTGSVLGRGCEPLLHIHPHAHLGSDLHFSCRFVKCSCGTSLHYSD